MEKKNSRRQFIIQCSSGLTLGILSQISPASAQIYNLGALWKSKSPPNIRTTQVMLRSAISDASYTLNTTQVMARAAASSSAVTLNTTQVFMRVAVRT